MNTIKYYGPVENNRVAIVRFRIPRSQRYNTPAGHTGIAQADAMMLGKGLTRRRPSVLGPHGHAHQRPGYHQPSEREQRRARQTLRRAGRPLAA